MRGYDHALGTGYLRICKIRDITFNLSALQPLKNGILVGKKISRIVQDDHAVFHHGDRLFVKHSSGAVKQRNVDRNVITLPVNILHILDMADCPGQIPRGVHGDVGVIPVNFHSKRDRRVCYQLADGAKTDDPQLLSADLTAGKLFFLLFRQLLDLRIVFFFPDPGNAADDISRCQKHSGDHQFLDAVGVGSRRVEYNDSPLRTFFQRNIIDSGACPCNRIQIFRKLHLMHRCTAHQDCLRFFKLLCFLILIAEISQPNLRNGIQAIILIHHRFASSNSFINATSASTPSFGIAL